MVLARENTAIATSDAVRDPATRALGETTQVVDRRSPAYLRWAQAALNQVMGTGLSVDGVIGPRTRDAVRAFQGQRGLPADGVIGPRTEAALVAAGASAPPGAPSRTQPAPAPRPPRPAPPAGFPGASAVPAVIGRQSQPPLTTLYVALSLGGERPARPMTGIFLPENYRPLPHVDVIIYLHGFKRASPGLSINAYWDQHRFPQRALREGLNQSSKNVVLVAPTLGPRSEAGRLVAPGGLDAYLDAVMAAVKAHGPYPASSLSPQVGNLILAGHSGGGLPMRQVALAGQRYTANIKACWGFDCLYNTPDPSLWARWATAHPSAQLSIFYTDKGGTRDNSMRLQSQGLPNVLVQRSSAAHDWVPMRHWQDCIQHAPFLRDR